MATLATDSGSVCPWDTQRPAKRGQSSRTFLLWRYPSLCASQVNDNHVNGCLVSLCPSSVNLCLRLYLCYPVKLGASQVKALDSESLILIMDQYQSNRGRNCMSCILRLSVPLDLVRLDTGHLSTSILQYPQYCIYDYQQKLEFDHKEIFSPNCRDSFLQLTVKKFYFLISVQ
jgi:hypothetical protein